MQPANIEKLDEAKGVLPDEQLEYSDVTALEIMLASEIFLAESWDTPKEDEAWESL